MAILPRSAGAVVIHAHSGHGLHTHVVSGLENARTSLDSVSFHARHHAHEHPAAHGQPGHHHEGPGEGELFIGLPSDPVLASSSGVSTLDPSREPVAPFLAVFRVESGVSVRARPAHRRPPRPRGRTARSGTRVLLATSRALLL